MSISRPIFFHVLVTCWLIWLTACVAAFCPARQRSVMLIPYPTRVRPKLTSVSTTTQLPISAPSNNNDSSPSSISSILNDYWNMIRPYTILQAVGALVVGRLAHGSCGFTRNLGMAALSVYLSYGAGMAVNDCVDVDTDAQSQLKQDRAMASGRISRKAGWTYCGVLSLFSLLLSARIGGAYTSWMASNLAIMLGYAVGLQKLFLIKNILCGWLAISPLVGASLLLLDTTTADVAKLWRLAAIGFPVQVAREILKDIEDVETDQGRKRTLPIMVGEVVAHRIAYTLVGLVCSAMLTKSYWSMFASTPPVYALGLCLGVPMCIRASMLPLKQGEALLKKSIYVLLAGMIGGLWFQEQGGALLLLLLPP